MCVERDTNRPAHVSKGANVLERVLHIIPIDLYYTSNEKTKSLMTLTGSIMSNEE